MMRGGGAYVEVGKDTPPLFWHYTHIRRKTNKTWGPLRRKIYLSPLWKFDKGFRYAVRIGNVPLIGGGERVARGFSRLRVLAYPKVAYLALP